MRPSILLGVCALGACVASVGCSSTDDHSPSASGGAVANGGSDAGGGTSSGGSANGGSANGGSGGAGAEPASGGASSGGAEQGTGGAPPACAPGAADGGLTWRDFAEGTCKECPATPLTECAQFTADPGPSFDTVTQVLTLRVTPGLNEILGIRIEGRTGTADSAEFTFVAARGTVSENVVTFDFSGMLPEGATGFYDGLIVGDDACGEGIDTSTSQKLQFRLDGTGVVDGPACVD